MSESLRRPLTIWRSCDPILDNEGMQLGADGPSFRWDQMLRVAYYIDWGPWATCEIDYLAFQTSNPDESYWIDLGLRHRSERFRRDLEERIGPIEYPPMKDLTPDSQGDHWGYVLWPSEERGQPLYSGLKVRRWFLFTKQVLIYASLPME